VSPSGISTSRAPNTGLSNALKVKLMKLTTPVAVPPSSGGFASLMTVQKLSGLCIELKSGQNVS
jgi:hypothetical protein